jgi:hypothetical protein
MRRKEKENVYYKAVTYIYNILFIQNKKKETTPLLFQSTCCYRHSLLMNDSFFCINYTVFEYEPSSEVLCEPWFGVKSTLSLCALEKNYFYVNFAHFRKCISIDALWMRSIAECLERRTVIADVATVLGSIHGLINYIDTKTKCRHL